MSEQFWIVLLQYAIKFGIDAALAIINAQGKTIDDAIKALEVAKTETAAEIRDKAP